MEVDPQKGISEEEDGHAFWAPVVDKLHKSRKRCSERDSRITTGCQTCSSLQDTRCRTSANVLVVVGHFVRLVYFQL